MSDLGRKDQTIRAWGVYVPEDAAAEVGRVLDAVWLNTGSQERLFRETFSQRFNIPYCVATCNGTASLRASLAMLEIGPGDEVIVPEMTWIGGITGISCEGATPVFVDIERDTWCMDPKKFEERSCDTMHRWRNGDSYVY